MTNPLIPYTFVPGTKAKAQEVNSNFVSLAEAIQTTQSNLTQQYSAMNSYIEENLADKDLINSNTFTNCIIGAPNGVATYSNNSITVKSGLKVIIADGRDVNDAFNNIVYTLNDDITVSDLDTNEDRYLCISTTGVSAPVKVNVYYTENTPPKLIKTTYYGLWYKPSENRWYRAEATDSTPSWSVLSNPVCIIGEISCNGTNITDVKTYQPIDFLKRSDIKQFVSLPLPSATYTNLSVGFNVEYTAPANGWVYLFASSTTDMSTVSIANVTTEIWCRANVRVGGWRLSCLMPVRKNDVFKISDWSCVSDIVYRFYYAEGEV